MRYFTFILGFILFSSCSSKSQVNTSSEATNKSKFVNNYQGDKVTKTESEWKEILSDKDYYVIREKGTERSFTGDLLAEKREGVYICKACQLPLFESQTKFKSGTGWPSFYAPLVEDNIATDTDYHIGYARTEVMCGRCEGHLGHVFDDGPRPTGLRYCINSASLLFEESKEKP